MESRFQIRSIADPRNRSESAWYSESRGELSDVRMIRDKNLLHMEVQSGLGGSWATRIEIFDRNSSSSDVESVAVFQAADTLGELIDWCETFIIEQGHAFELNYRMTNASQACGGEKKH